MLLFIWKGLRMITLFKSYSYYLYEFINYDNKYYLSRQRSTSGEYLHLSSTHIQTARCSVSCSSSVWRTAASAGQVASSHSGYCPLSHARVLLFLPTALRLNCSRQYRSKHCLFSVVHSSRLGCFSTVAGQSEPAASPNSQRSTRKVRKLRARLLCGSRPELRRSVLVFARGRSSPTSSLLCL